MNLDGSGRSCDFFLDHIQISITIGDTIEVSSGGRSTEAEDLGIRNQIEVILSDSDSIALGPDESRRAWEASPGGLHIVIIILGTHTRQNQPRVYLSRFGDPRSRVGLSE